MSLKEKQTHFDEWILGPLTFFTVSILDQASRSLWPVHLNDASNIPSLRSHGSQLAGIAAWDSQRTHITARLTD